MVCLDWTLSHRCRVRDVVMRCDPVQATKIRPVLLNLNVGSAGETDAKSQN